MTETLYLEAVVDGENALISCPNPWSGGFLPGSLDAVFSLRYASPGRAVPYEVGQSSLYISTAGRLVVLEAENASLLVEKYGGLACSLEKNGSGYNLHPSHVQEGLLEGGTLNVSGHKYSFILRDLENRKVYDVKPTLEHVADGHK